MNIQTFISSQKNKRGRGSFALLATATLVVSGFFIANMALAAHTAAVSVDKALVQGGTTQTYSFSVTNGSGSANSIFQIKVTPPAGFTITGSLVCPSAWGADTTGNVATCLIDPFVVGTLTAGSQTTVSFSATAPSNDSSVPWVVQTKDNAGVEITNNTDAITIIDATVPTIGSVVTFDTDGNGQIDQALVTFSESVDDSTFSASDFAISGTAAASIDTGTADDNQITLNFATQIDGTEIKNLDYTQGVGADMVGNLLATVSAVATDQAAPVFLSARTTAINQIEVTFSENIASTYTKNDFGVGDNSSANNVTSTSNPESNATILLNLTTPIQTGDTPVVYFDSTWSGGISDAQGNLAATVSRVTTDNIAPIFASTMTLSTTSIQVTFSEPMSVVAATDFTVDSNTVASLSFSGPATTAILTLDTPIGTGNRPVVGTIASPTGTKDNAATPNTISGNLSSPPDDGIAPTVVLTTVAGSYINAGQSPISLTATFSESVTEFIVDDVVVTNGTAGNFAGSGSVYTFDVTPTTEGAVTISVLADAAQDAATTPNLSIVSNTISTIYDSIVPDAPVVTSIATDDFINDSEKAAIVVVGTAEAGSTVSVSLTDGAGTPVTVTGSGTADGNGDYSISIDGTTLTDGTITPSVTATDAAGNASAAATTPTAEKDVVAPSITITGTLGGQPVGTHINSAPFNLSFTFSESVTGFAQNDLQLSTNAYFPGTFDGSGSSYSINVSPNGWPGCGGAGCSQGPITMDIAAGVAQDAAGNTNAAAAQFSVTFDNVAPTVALTADDSDLIVHDGGNTVVITATFNEEMTASPTISINVADNTDADITSVAMTDSGNGIVWTYNWSVPAAHDGAAVVTVAGSDLATNAYAGATNVTFTIDNTAPSADETTAITTPTNDTTPDVVVTVESGATWEILDGSTVLASGTGTGAGQTATLSVLTEGIYNLNLVATDVAGNVATAVLTAFTVDTTVPTVSISSPLADSVTKGISILLASSAEDASGVTCEYQVDGGALTAIACTGGAIGSLTDGRRTITLVATDGAGNAANDSISIVIDTDNTLSVNGAGGADFTTIQEAVTKATASDTIAVAAGTYAEDVSIDKTLTLTGTGSPTAISFTLASGAVATGSTGITAATITVDSGASVQDGILLSATGGTVNVGAGTFAESIDLNKDVTIDGAGNTLTIIDPAAGGYGFRVTADGASISDLQIQTEYSLGVDTDSGILVIEADNITVSGNVITTASGTAVDGTEGSLGIWVCGTDSGCATPSNNLAITGNTITINGVSTAIYAEQSNTAHSGWTISNNIITADAGVPLELYDVTDSTVDSNTLDGSTTNSNTIWSSERDDIANLVFTSNTISDSSGSMVAFLSDFSLLGDGTDNTSATTVTITGNTFSSWDSRGLRIGDGVTAVTANTNKFLDTGETLKNEDAGEVNAEANWWGDAAGPGTGAIVGTVDYRPWYLTADLTGLDQTIPTADTFVPSNNSVGISPTATISATFSEAVTIAASDITFNPVVAGIGVTFDSDTNVATITHDALADNTTYTVTIGTTVADLSGNQLASTSWSFTTSGSYSITLTQGWNLVSFPVIPVDTNIATVLGSASPDIDAVWSYDPSAGEWLVYRPNTDTELNSLFNVTSGYGYWVDYTSATPTTLSGPGNLFLEGNNTPPQRTLHAGWNLIGYFQKQNTSSVTADYALKTLYNPETNLSWWSQLFGYNNTTKQFTSVVDPSVAGTSDLDPGKGYWVLLSGKATDTYIYAPGLTP